MTISFSQLGNMGHLGNQMFQYAALRGIAENNGHTWAIPAKHAFGSSYPVKSIIWETFVLSEDIVTDVPGNPALVEKQFHFDEDLFNNCPDNVDLNGYFQSYKYFQNVKDKIIEDFTFKKTAIKPFDNYVSVHVRRGDYVHQPQYHPTCDAEYYKKAMDHFPGQQFVVFSDDIEWCKQQEIFNDCYFSIDNDASDDLYLMSNADHNIIANSSFSWWAAYLNKNNGVVICPERWFGVYYDHYDMSDLRPKEWIQL